MPPSLPVLVLAQEVSFLFFFFCMMFVYNGCFQDESIQEEKEEKLKEEGRTLAARRVQHNCCVQGPCKIAMLVSHMVMTLIIEIAYANDGEGLCVLHGGACDNSWDCWVGDQDGAFDVNGNPCTDWMKDPTLAEKMPICAPQVLWMGLIVGNILAYCTGEKLNPCRWWKEVLSTSNRVEKSNKGWGWTVYVISILDCVLMVISIKSYIYGENTLAWMTCWLFAFLLDELVDLGLIGLIASAREPSVIVAEPVSVHDYKRLIA